MIHYQIWFSTKDDSISKMIQYKSVGFFKAEFINTKYDSVLNMIQYEWWFNIKYGAIQKKIQYQRWFSAEDDSISNTVQYYSQLNGVNSTIFALGNSMFKDTKHIGLKIKYEEKKLEDKITNKQFFYTNFLTPT